MINVLDYGARGDGITDDAAAIQAAIDAAAVRGGRLSGSLLWHKPWGKQEFPAVCGEHFRITAFKDF